MSEPIVKKAEVFRGMNNNGNLLLPNAWDAASARVFEEAGFAAIGTTSAGIAYTRGLRDGQRITRAAMMHEIAIIVASVSIPVTADIEARYGTEPSDIVETIRQVVRAGAVGVNLEDNAHDHGGALLFDSELQAERIRAARDEAERQGVALTINARTDTFLLGLGSNDEERTALTINRGLSYLGAGADLIFVPLLVSLPLVRRLADAFGGRLSLMAMPGAPPVHDLFEAGAKRVSIGQTAMLAGLGHLRAIAQELHSTGTWSLIEANFVGFGEAEALFVDSPGSAHGDNQS
jgi:2-methylisocitrate lyase-like PEP mutase family enzyme